MSDIVRRAEAEDRVRSLAALLTEIGGAPQVVYVHPGDARFFGSHVCGMPVVADGNVPPGTIHVRREPIHARGTF